MSRQWYELRVRERLGTGWVKKSKFYFVQRPGEAMDKYKKHSKSEFTFMWCEKDRRHSPELLATRVAKTYAEIRKEQGAPPLLEEEDKGVVATFLDIGSTFLRELREQEKSKVQKRRFNEQREKTTYQPE